MGDILRKNSIFLTYVFCVIGSLLMLCYVFHFNDITYDILLINMRLVGIVVTIVYQVSCGKIPKYLGIIAVLLSFVVKAHITFYSIYGVMWLQVATMYTRVKSSGSN